jgi:hypothetical protein
MRCGEQRVISKPLISQATQGRRGIFHKDADLVERHGIAQTLARVGNAAAVETDVFRIFRELFDLLEHILACQHAEVARMLPCADIFLHITLL